MIFARYRIVKHVESKWRQFYRVQKRSSWLYFFEWKTLEDFDSPLHAEYYIKQLRQKSTKVIKKYR